MTTTSSGIPAATLLVAGNERVYSRPTALRMEVWGGNSVTDSAFAMPRLRLRVYCQPYGQSDSGGEVHT